ncbi:MAG TPA: DEAD/DEAH box helicase family protein [Bryobacteraceae bacterium]|nr:DEAD/DEAH box helicase family protein [Bryobacteraceae bacterium]
MIDYREKALEDAVEESLVARGGYRTVPESAFDRESALIASEALAFVQATQEKTWKVLAAYYGSRTEAEFIAELRKALDARGTLDVLRHGLEFFGQTFRLAYFAPASGLNPDSAKLYAANRLGVTRQVHFDTRNEQSVDLMLSLNGIPVATAELKNHFTGQTVRDAIAQYRGRDLRGVALFQFKSRALVHFAADPDEVYMTTWLEGESTRFLPFNKGRKQGAGNPDHPGGHRTAYLWEEIWARDSWLDLIGRFLHLEKKEKTDPATGKTRTVESLIFPRYHQIDAVRKIVADARDSGAGKSYLIQHSAGSGKSNSIAWLAHRLASLHDAQDRKVFDSVVVITDRLVLDKQLQETIYQFEHKQGVVVKIDEDSKQLAHALAAGTPIVITTLQKFPFVTNHIGSLPDRRYAVIIDEAHSSQSGEGATRMKALLGGERVREEAKRIAQEEQLPDYEEEVLRVALARRHQPNLSFFAFTATPKYKTLVTFGVRGANGEPEPFHHYSMKQAIEEGFILDVLRHYTTYKVYYRLVKAAGEDPEVERKKATKALARFARLHPHNISQKTEIMVEHYRTHVRPKIGGRAKAMVVTNSRLEAVRYKRAFDKYIGEKGYDFRTLVAFSGTLTDPDDGTGEELTEVNVNGGHISERALPKEFCKDVYGVLIVAEKYQTGFDQPLLHTMYVDKRLGDVQAVQTLSRLNRTCAGKEDTFVLDFVNDPEEIVAAFRPYYADPPVVAEHADPRQLYNLRNDMLGRHVVYEVEVDQFAAVFFAPGGKKDTMSGHALMTSIVDKAVTRFEEAPEKERGELRDRMEAFRRLYGFLSQVIPFFDTKLEKFDAYLRFLLTKLPRRAGSGPLDLDDEVRLRFYRIQKIQEARLLLEDGQPGRLDAPTEVGTGKAAEEEVPLSRVVDVLNERFGTDFTANDELFWDQVREDAAGDESVRGAAEENTRENFSYVFDKKLEELVMSRLDRNEKQALPFLENEQLRAVLTRILGDQIYELIRGSARRAHGRESIHHTS